jgi:hypothetical protein
MYFTSDSNLKSSTPFNGKLKGACDVCGGDHNVLIISLENGGHIITHPFRKEKATRVKVDSGIKGKAIGLDLIDIFWPKDGDI